MFVINVYSSIAKTRRCFTFPEGQTIAEYLKDENINFDNTIILVSGDVVTKDYSPKENDIIFVRELPSAATTVALIITSVVAVVAGVAAGISLYKAKQAQAEAEKAMKNANSASSNVEALPFLKGANNQAASGRSFPYVIGRHYFTPYRLQPKYYEVLGYQGDEEYCNLVLEAGFNNLVIESISLGNNKIKKYGESFDDIKYIKPQSIIDTFDEGTYYNEKNVIEIQQKDDFGTEQFNKKIVSNFINQEIAHDYGTASADVIPVVTQLEDNAKSMDICILFDGLRKYVNNRWSAQSCTIKAYWSNLDSPSTDDLSQWNELTASEDTNFLQYSWDGTYNNLNFNIYKYHSAGLVSSNTFQYKHGCVTEAVVKNELMAVANSTDWLGGYWEFVSGDYPSYLIETVPDVTRIYNIFYTVTSGEILDVVTVYSFQYATEREKVYSKYTKSNIFSYNSTSQMRFCLHKDFTAEESYGKSISVMLIRSTPKAESNSNESCYLYYVNTECYDPLKSTSTELVTCKPIEDDAREKCCRIGIRMKADDNNESLADSVNIVACGVARTWDSETSTWSKDKTPTRNAAAWILEVLSSDIHAWSKFNDSEIDLESLGSLYETCEEKEYWVDGVITEDKTKQSVLDDLCAACHCSLIFNNDGLLEVIEDKAEENAIALLNTQDISDFSVTKSFERKPNGYKVTFTNNESWTKETFYCMKDGTSTHDASDTITEIAPNFITDYAHAWDIARRTLAESYLQPKTVTVNVGKEGAYYPLHSCVLVQLPHLKIGIASSVVTALIYTNNVITGIKIADKVTFEDGKSYGVIIQQMDDNGKHLIAAVVTGEGTTDTLYLDGSEWEYIPTSQNILSFGELDDSGTVSKVTEKFKICDVSPTDNGYSLTLKEYNASIYDDSGAIPDYASPITKGTVNSSNKAVQYTNEEVREKIDEAQSVTLATALSFSQGVNVFADVSSCGFLVDADGYTLNRQTISFDVHVIQGGTTEIDFIYGTFEDIPDGMTVTFDYHTITMTVEQGTKLVNGSVKLPVIYRLIKQNYQYEDENGVSYGDENGEAYGCYEVENDSKEYDFFVQYTGVKGGNKIEQDFTSLDDIQKYSFLVGDYFTFKGDTVTTTLAELGSFDKGATYIYCGADSERSWKFKIDNNQEHMITSLSDVLSVLDEEIEANNVKTVTLLNRLVANNIFVKKLTAQNAFIENLMSNNLTVQNAIQSANYVEGESGFKLLASGTIYANSGHFSGGIGNDTTVQMRGKDQEVYLHGDMGLITINVIKSAPYTYKTYKTGVYIYFKHVWSHNGYITSYDLTELTDTAMLISGSESDQQTPPNSAPVILLDSVIEDDETVNIQYVKFSEVVFL